MRRLKPSLSKRGESSLEGGANSGKEAVVNRNDRRRRRTHTMILEAADRVFHRMGVDNATVSHITEEADVAYGSFYNHFKSLDDVVSALAAQSLQRVADRTGMILEKAERVELLPCVGARVVMRTLWQDPAIRWLLGRPYVLVEEFKKAAVPFMLSAEQDAVKSGRLKPAGGHKSWLTMYPWMLIAELNALVETGDILAHEERFARVSLRFLGIDDALAPELIKRSRTLVMESGMLEPKQSHSATRRKS